MMVQLCLIIHEALKLILSPISNGRPTLQAYVMVYRALSNILVLPWPETTHLAQRWDARAHELSKLVSGATNVFQQLQQTPDWSQNAQLHSQGEHSLSQTEV